VISSRSSAAVCPAKQVQILHLRVSHGVIYASREESD
jgi:hypothetical protein